MQGQPAVVADAHLAIETMINRSYPGFVDVCWPESLTLRRLQLGVSPVCWRLSVFLTTWQHWCRCPELRVEAGRIRFCLLLPAGLLPGWSPRFTYSWFPG
jgi:hypothetical protein